jgi:flagellar protein FliS
MRNNVSQYNQVNRESGVTDADPHRLVLMLLEGALGKIAMVKGLMMRKEIAKKGEVIGQAISIVAGLRSSLDLSAGGELAANLDDLYEYMERRLLQANIKNDTTILDEVSALLHEIKAGWESIPLEVRVKPSPDLSVVSCSAK